MKNGSLLASVVLCTSLAGCSTVTTPSNNLMVAVKEIKSQRLDQESQDKKINALTSDAYGEALDFCTDAMGGSRQGFSKAQKRQLTLAGVGIVAGSIIVPTLAAAHAGLAIIASFGGVSGAANAAQLQVGNAGESPLQQAQVYEAMRVKLGADMQDYANAPTAEAKAAAISDMNFTCKFPPLPGVKDSDTGSSQPTVTTTTTTPHAETTTTVTPPSAPSPAAAASSGS